MEVYLVGGAVRDKQLKLKATERDWVVVGSSESEMLTQGFKRVGKDFPVFLHPSTHEEYALARTERKKGKGYYGFECHASPEVTLEQDLSRRDLTINAIAEDEQGNLIDPFHGLDDLEKKQLRHVSPAFSEDPVRILRIARFAARFAPLGFTIAPETMALMRSMVEAGEVEALVPERVWQEMVRALSEQEPSQFFLVLRECGALMKIWPSLNKLWGVPQPPQYHPEIDTGLHVMMALQQAVSLSLDPEVRFAVVCHDLGKGKTPEKEWPSHRGHEEKGVPLIKAFCEQYRVPKEYRDLAILVSRYHLHCHKVQELKSSTLLKTLENLDVFRKPSRFEQFLLCCAADAKGRGGDLQGRNYPQADIMRSAYQLVVKVSAQDFLDKGYEGALLGKKIHEERIKKLEAWKTNLPPTFTNDKSNHST